MKILEAQSGTLTNHEVYQLLREKQEEAEARKIRAPRFPGPRRVPKGEPKDLTGYNTVTKEYENYVERIAPHLLTYAPYPRKKRAAQEMSAWAVARRQDFTSSATSNILLDPNDHNKQLHPHNSYMHALGDRLLYQYDIEKAEFLQIINLRPTTPPELDVIIEEMEDRFTEVQIEDILAIVKDILGDPDKMEEDAVGGAAEEGDDGGGKAPDGDGVAGS